jgi:glycosyltransferase involved in cell wall biosynthesis
MPEVRARYPEIRLVISSPEAPREPALGHRINGVEIDAPQPDVRPALSRAAVAVAPLWTSANVRQAVLQPMGAGIPVVVPSETAQSLRAEPGRDVLVADTPKDFAARIVELLRDRDAAAEVGTRGQLLASTRYAWSVVAAPILELVESLTKAPAPQATSKPLAQVRGTR